MLSNVDLDALLQGQSIQRIEIERQLNAGTKNKASNIIFLEFWVVFPVSFFVDFSQVFFLPIPGLKCCYFIKSITCSLCSLV